MKKLNIKNLGKVRLIIIVFVAIFLLSGCSDESNSLATWGVLHSGTDSSEIELEKGNKVYFTYESSAFKGNITMILENPEGEEVIKTELSEDGKLDYIADIEGSYKLIVKKSGVACRYSIKWEIE